MTPEKFDQLQESVSRIERAIVGDPDMGHRGIADRIEWVERKVAGHEKQILKWIGAITVIGMLVPFVTKMVFKG
jgi:hypothetical protein